jgi:RecG-like helicase
MTPDNDQFKRNVAFKFRIGDLLLAKPVFDQDKLSFLELGDKKIIRVNLIGNIVDRYESEGNTKYCFLTLDDGSGQIKLKSFGDDISKLAGISQGQTVLVIGLVRHFNNETYLAPEIVREQDPKYLLVRKLEIEKERKKFAKPLGQEQVKALKDELLEKIKSSEGSNGIDIDQIIMSSEFRDKSPDLIHQEIKKLLEEGIIFEPRPGRIRYLG